MIEVTDERQELTDADAIRRSVVDPDAFVAVFDRHFDLLHRFLRVRAGDAAADDLVAQTFEVAFRRRADYDLTRADARPWLYGIALNQLRRERRNRRRGLRAVSRLFVREAVDDEPADGVDELRRLLDGLRDEDRDLLLLYACLELSYAECAEALGVPIGTVRSRLHRVRERLRREVAR